MDRTAVDSRLPILGILIIAFRAVIFSRQLQAFVPTILEERAFPMRLFLFLHIFSFFSVHLFLVPPLLLQ
ncbi:hypothetical protein EF849_22295, partial [Aeromonas jandaei]|nr:hypothetical protein [Aeromonas jandaei]